MLAVKLKNIVTETKVVLIANKKSQYKLVTHEGEGFCYKNLNHFWIDSTWSDNKFYI